MKKEASLLLVLSILLAGCAPGAPPEGIPPGAEAPSFSVGYIGCSNTKQTVYGYHWVGGANIWPADERRLHDYDNGAVVNWRKDGNRFWDAFDDYLEENPITDAVWWQLCIRQGEAGMAYEDAIPVLEAIRKRIPGVTIYISPLADYAENVCEITGVEGIERAKALAHELDSRNEDVLPGPILGPLYLAEITDQEKDRCHLNEAGMQKLGEQMKAFFDAAADNAVGGGTGTVEGAPAAEEPPPAPEPEHAPEKEELSFEEQVWRRRIEAAMAPVPCPDAPKPDYPASYYQGPLIDTHLHIPALPDWSPEEDSLPTGQGPEGRFGGPQALLGWNVKMGSIACTLKREGTRKNFAFFPVYQEIPEQLLEVADRTTQQHPALFSPFIMPPGNDNDPGGFPTVDAAALRSMLAVHPGLFRGYGEIGLYAREGGADELPPDSPRLQEIYPIIREHRLLVYVHPGEGHKDNFERVLRQHPDIIFVVHGDEIEEDIVGLMDEFPNIYYTNDPSYAQHFSLYVGKSKEAFLEAAERDFDSLIRKDLRRWQAMIEQHPDRFMWGTDRGDAVWNYDPDVGLFLVKYARAFVGQLDPAVQEKFAYKNAERLIPAGN